MKGFLPVLTLIFITLKLMGYINWSWWLVLLPLYGGIIMVTIIIVLGVLAGGKVTVKRIKL